MFLRKLVFLAALAATPAAAEHREGVLPDGAAYAIDTPQAWNGTLVLYSHGYVMGPANPATDAPSPAVRDALLAKGYALAGSAYRTTGWALVDAVPDQAATLDAFATQVGKPKRTLAWGHSMGGLATVALAERYPDRIDGALPMCGSVGGTLGMMNTALDGAFAFQVLLAPQLKLVRVTDDRAQAMQVAATIAEARKTPQGRARLALAAALSQLPGWTNPKTAEPAPDDLEARLDQQADSRFMGTFLPRSDLEGRAGGVFSWNVGVDYARLLDRTGQRAAVEAFYRKAGLDLAKDLATLKAAPRIAADRSAVAYMRANYAPTGRIAAPMLSLHTSDDPATVVTNEASLREAVAAAGKSALLRQVFTHRAGHCNFTAGEQVAALEALDQRVASGRWGDLSPAALNAAAEAASPSETQKPAFAAYKPARLERPCIGCTAPTK